jgi:hypothetical protein
VDPVSLFCSLFLVPAVLLCPCSAHYPVCRARGSASVEALPSLRSFLVLLWCWFTQT